MRSFTICWSDGNTREMRGLEVLPGLGLCGHPSGVWILVHERTGLILPVEADSPEALGKWADEHLARFDWTASYDDMPIDDVHGVVMRARGAYGTRRDSVSIRASDDPRDLAGVS